MILLNVIDILTETNFQYPDTDRRRPPVPNHKDKPLMGTKTSRNFITTNAVTNILSVPRIPAPKYVDTPKGAKHTVEVRTTILSESYYYLHVVHCL